MHSSDETGDERKGLATTGGTAADGDPATSSSPPANSKLPAHAFRERIRRASVAAAQSSAPPAAADQHGLPDSSAPSLVPPEQSGVHDRTSDEPEPPTAVSRAVASSIAPAAVGGGGGPLFDPTGASGVFRPTPRAWPFAGGARDGRPQHHTQLGLGMPSRAAAQSGASGASGASVIGRNDEPPESKMSDARSRMDTRDTKRSGAAHANASASSGSGTTGPHRPAPSTAPSPGAYKITPPRPFRAHDPAKWSPTSTKPQRASLLRGDAPKAAASSSPPAAPPKELPRFAQTIKHTPSLGPNATDAEIARELDAAYAAQLAAADKPGKYSYSLRDVAEEFIEAPGRNGDADPAFANEEDETARARRYTPKQRRNTQPRGRTNLGTVARAKGPEAQPGQPAPVQSVHDGERDHRELASTVPDIRIPASARPPALPLGAGILNVTKPHGHAAQVVTPDTPTQPRGRPVPRLPLSAPPSAFSQSPRAEVQFQSPRAPFMPASTRRDRVQESPLHRHEASIVVDPTLNGTFTEVDPSQMTRLPDAQPGYQPLPSDPAAFEQFMRDQAAARGARLNWKQQATLVIPRETLELPEERRFINPKLAGGVLTVAAATALLVFGIMQFSERTGIRSVPLDTSTSAAHAAAGGVTVIATEPSGAELLLDGAVVGNTPLEVVRPQVGQPELTYVVRLRGFTQEAVRLSQDSQPAIRVTLTPETGVP